jgi:hypothetical protein
MKPISLHFMFAAMALAVAPSALAQKGGMNVPEHAVRPVVMELFSSQGCGKCPTANANIAKLSERSDVIALTYPVGYWDYLGWDDTFAKPEFTERQKRYNRALKYRGPYTPQVVYSGRLHGSGVNMKVIEEKFAIRDITPYPTTVTFDGANVVVAPTAGLTQIALKTGDKTPDAKPLENKGTIVLVHYKPGTTTITPGGGANKGKTMTYVNLVTGFETLGEWTGGTQKFAAKCMTGCVALVQRGGTEGVIIGAAQKK